MSKQPELPAFAANIDEDDDEAQGQESARRMDDEIRQMSAVVRILDRLEPATRARVVRWLGDRYGCE